jgi:hypothetical protein
MIASDFIVGGSGGLVEWKVKETIVPVESRTNCDFGKN